MRTLTLLLLLCGSSFAQQVPPDLSASLADTSLITVIKKYASHIKELGLRENEVILLLRSTSATAGDPDKSVWALGNLVSVNELRKSPPSLISKIDGYWIAIYFNIDVNAYFRYSPGYLRFLEESVYQPFKSPQKTRYYIGWQITLTKGKKASVLGML